MKKPDILIAIDELIDTGKSVKSAIATSTVFWEVQRHLTESPEHTVVSYSAPIDYHGVRITCSRVPMTESFKLMI